MLALADEELVTIPQAAAEFGLSQAEVRGWIVQGLEYLKVNGANYTSIAAMYRYIERADPENRGIYLIQ